MAKWYDEEAVFKTFTDTTLSSRSDSTKYVDEGSPKGPPARDVHGFKWFLVVISLTSVTFLWGLDGTITADMQATFVEDFHSIEKLAWNSVAFFLGATACVLSWGQVYGQFDAKWVFITCIIIFEAGSALCGAAPDIDALIAGRCICGVGGSGMYVAVLTLLSMTTTEKERGLYMGYPGITWGIGTVLGPIVGGAFAESSATWRWGFYINLCIGALFSPVYLFLVPSKDPRPQAKWGERLSNMDYVGLSLLAGSTSCLMLAINFGGLTFSWTDGSMIALWVVAGVLLLLFAAQQGTGIFTKQTVFPVSMMKHLRVLIIFINETCASTACFLPCYFIPLYFQYIENEKPLMAGVHLLPFIMLMVSTVMVCGAAVSKFGRWVYWFFYGGALVLIGGSLMYTVDEHTSPAKVYCYIVLLGSGGGAYVQRWSPLTMSFQMSFNACQEYVDASLIPAAVGLITWGQLVAPAFTLSIANAVFLNLARDRLTEILPPYAPSLSIVSGVGKQYLQRLPQNIRQRVVHEVVKTMANAYVLVIVAGALTLVLSTALLMRLRQTAKKPGKQ